jgi:hypothetical protein
MSKKRSFPSLQEHFGKPTQHWWENDQMISRTISKTVTFVQPFRLDGLNGIQPAGSYIVETDEELLQALSFPAYRRTDTRIRLPTARSDQVARIDPAELEAALARDGKSQSSLDGPPVESPADRVLRLD